MNDTINIPVPQDSGVTGTQTAATDVVPATPNTPFPKNELVEGLCSVVEKDVGAIGGLTPSTWVTSVVQHFNRENCDLKKELAELRDKLDAAKDRLHAAETDKARLEVKLDNERGSRTLRDLGIALGTGFATLSIDLYEKDLKVLAAFVGLGGVALLICSWVSVPKGRAQ